MAPSKEDTPPQPRPKSPTPRERESFLFKRVDNTFEIGKVRQANFEIGKKL